MVMDRPMKFRFILATCIFLSLCKSQAIACSICGGDFRGRATLRQDATAARVVVFGKLTNPRPNPDPLVGGGTTDLKIERVLKGRDLAVGATITLPRYFPGTAAGPTHALAFFDMV